MTELKIESEIPMPEPLALESKTDFVHNQKAKSVFKKPTILDTVWDLMGLEKAMEVKYESKLETVKINYFKFFIFGILFAYASIFISLQGIGIILTWQQYAWMIGSFGISIGFAFIWGKFKEAVPLILNDPEKLKNLLDKIVTKLS